MNSHTTGHFRRAFTLLPEEVRRHARGAYRLFRQNPYHASLQFKRVHPTDPVFSVRIGLGHRAVGVLDNNEIIWFWIGPHAEYSKLVDRL